jgi:hypothetical protein
LLVAVLLLCAPAAAQTPADDARMRRELGVNNMREARLRAVAPAIMPDCVLVPSDGELAAFFAYWRVFARQQADNEAAFHASIPDRKQFEANQAAMDAATGVRRLPPSAIVSWERLERVGPDLPGARDAAKDQLELWHLYRCADTRYHDGRYQGHYGFDADPNRGSLMAAAADAPDGKRLRLPDLSAVEPLGALGKVFHAAKDRGLLSFRDAKEERYFFLRYDGGYYVNLRENDATRRWFSSPPWAPATADDKPR